MSAIDWAEESLGLTKTWEESQIEHGVLDDLASHLDNASDSKRVIGDKIKDREGELLIEERGKHADQSATWLDKHMATAKYKDPNLVILRQEYQAASSTLSGLEYDWEVQKRKLSLLEARMVRDGGYLNFLAAAKVGEVASALAQLAPKIVTAAAQTLKTTQTQQETQGDGQSSGNTAG